MKHNALIPLFIALILLVLASVGYGLWYASVSTLSTQAASLAADVAAKNDDVARIANAKAALATLSEEEATLEQYFVSTKDVVSFLEELQATGKSLGTKVDVVSVAAEDAGTAPHLTLSLKIEGSFDAVIRTLGAIEFASRAITVSDVSIGINGKANWIATGSFTVGTRSSKTASTTRP